MQIAIDGPASSGKSTIAKLVAKHLNFLYIDTGAMYRATTLAFIQAHLDITDTSAVAILLNQLEIRLVQTKEGQKTFLNGVDVSRDIRLEPVTEKVSEVSALKPVREKMVHLQQLMAQKNSVVMDGRDIGTVVLPQADFKFFLTASAHVRAERRYRENVSKGLSSMSVEEIAADIERRDYYDSHRQISPLKMAEDAIKIDSSFLTISEVVDKILNMMA